MKVTTPSPEQRERWRDWANAAQQTVGDELTAAGVVLALLDALEGAEGRLAKADQALTDLADRRQAMWTNYMNSKGRSEAIWQGRFEALVEATAYLGSALHAEGEQVGT